MAAAALAVILPGCVDATGQPMSGADARTGAHRVQIPAGEVTLQAELALPPGPARASAVILLHGCGGPFPARDGQWRDLLVAAGHPVLLPDSFGSRGLGPQCGNPSRSIAPGTGRRQDAIAAIRWMAAQPFTPPGGVVVMGFSNGGSTVLATAQAGRADLPVALVRGFVAFYPGCRLYAEGRRRGASAWAPAAPMLLLMGAADDWTPPEPCRALADANPDRMTARFYPGAYHDFDAPGRPIRERRGLAFTANRDGVAHTGTDPAARDDALRRVPAFLAELPPVAP